eukprot:CAMPEP_0114624162 /NCGR_PEP_ID=MMETSP0168-20121206/10629_1 /TAXON_ID=95228 ORGANISM="Vannella sp., Strain DIVA3 517/6/12" /NCGR_SAMPLE_ID=MMETSP0168 /ASSEMBLY_ACC=CAM_ASM_000044 /LENGTH=450 /DNA_ID=CAMNT_0001835437 /DNA_START=156 /DNA_END=1504 /DNA_ORIENTATION=-
MPFLKKHKVNPVTGEPMTSKDLIKLTFHRNAEGDYQCPATFRPFTENTHIVAVKTTGNVYSYEAVAELNIKPKNWRDLMNDEPFTRKDIITINDPKNPRTINWADFHHMKNGLSKVAPKEKQKSAGLTNATVDSIASPSSAAGQPSAGAASPAPPNETVAERTARLNEKYGNDGGFTCAGFSAKEKAELTEAEKPGKKTKKKGYVQLRTSHGHINLELHCDLVPKACENFLGLCAQGYYDNVIFHRSIKNFMIQGGDPTGTGRGGKSIWGDCFPDEFKQQLSHSGRGILSMANHGPKTNGSQFFLLYKSAKHLDRKHTVFGKVVGGIDTLKNMEAVPTDDSDKPLTPITILGTQVFVDPFKEEEEKVAAAAAKVKEDEAQGMGTYGQWFSNPTGASAVPHSSSTSVGKYLPKAKASAGSGSAAGGKRAIDFGAVTSSQPKKQRKTGGAKA